MGGEVQFGDFDNSNYISFKSPNVLGSDNNYILPGAYPVEEGSVLASAIDGQMSWAKSLTNPMTAVGDLIYTNSFDLTDRLPIGSNGQVLTVRADGIPGWFDPIPAFADPMTSPGDMIYRNGSNGTARLPAGTVGQGLLIGATGVPSWGTIDTSVAAGNNTEIQYNNAGVFAASPAFTFDVATSEVSATKLLAVDAFTSTGPSTFSDTLQVTALLDARGNVSLGQDATTTVAVNSLVSTPLLPVGSQNLGGLNNRWGDLFVANTINMTDGGSNGILEYETTGGYTFYGTGTGGLAGRLTILSEESTRGVTIQSPLETTYSTGSYTLTLPETQSPAAQTSVLTNDGTGQLSWGDGATADLQSVTDAGSTTTNTITTGGLVVDGQSFPSNTGLADQVLVANGAGGLDWNYIDGDLY